MTEIRVKPSQLAEERIADLDRRRQKERHYGEPPLERVMRAYLDLREKAQDLLTDLDNSGTEHLWLQRRAALEFVLSETKDYRPKET